MTSSIQSWNLLTIAMHVFKIMLHYVFNIIFYLLIMLNVHLESMNNTFTFWPIQYICILAYNYSTPASPSFYAIISPDHHPDISDMDQYKAS